MTEVINESRESQESNGMSVELSVVCTYRTNSCIRVKHAQSRNGKH